MSDLHVSAQEVVEHFNHYGREFWINGTFDEDTKRILVNIYTQETDPNRIDLIIKAADELCAA